MKWSWTIGHVAGIKLRMHATFLILLAWLALVADHGWLRTHLVRRTSWETPLPLHTPTVRD
jgi:hypothetical protein